MGERRYIDFNLYLTRPSEAQGGCRVALLPSREVGETITPVTVGADQGPPEDLLPLLAAKQITLRKLVEFGKGLANWLLPEDTIRPLFREALKLAGNGGGVRLRLIIADHGLKKFPWEYAFFDPMGGADSMRGFLLLDPRISMVRHEPLPLPHPEPVEGKSEPTDLKMVIAAASPVGQRELQIDKEVRTIQEALKDFNVEGVRITNAPPLMDATPPEVAKALMGAGSTFVFHFVGHGTTETSSDPFSRGATKEEGFLYFIEDKSSKTAAKVRADDLARYLQQAGVRLAVMGACHTGSRSEHYPWDGVAGAFAARGIPATVAMQYEVIDSLAIQFTRSFYGALAGGLTIDEAMSFGRLAMYGESPPDLENLVNVEWGVPVLYSRMPDGKMIPELSRRETETASNIRISIQQAVESIEKGGEVIGIAGRIDKGIFKVVQKAGAVKGKAVGVDLDSL